MPDGRVFTLIDTAGIRKRAAVADSSDGAEPLSVGRALAAIRRVAALRCCARLQGSSPCSHFAPDKASLHRSGRSRSALAEFPTAWALGLGRDVLSGSVGACQMLDLQAGLPESVLWQWQRTLGCGAQASQAAGTEEAEMCEA